MEQSNYIDRLRLLIKKATSQFHTVEAVKEQLSGQGYEELSLRDEWNLQKGGKYMVVHHGSSMFAFTIGTEFDVQDTFRIAAAHGDFPGFRIKPNPEVTTEKYVQLNVESYGGVNLASWLDRGLSAAGRVVLKSEDVFRPEVRLIDFKKTMFTIPNIAIHLEREMNKGIEWNKQTQMLPVVGLLENGKEKHVFLEALAKQTGVQADDILDYELQVYNRDQAEIIGLEEEFLSAPRLDNLTSVQAITDGLIEGGRKTGLNVIAIFDHEEIGSRTKQGAGSMVLLHLLEKIYTSFGAAEQACRNAIAESLLLSVDVSHGFHPSYSGKYDPTNKNMLNQGFCIKESCSQSYATDSEAVGIVQQICEREQILYQKFVNRSDVTGGGTLGSIASAILPVRTVDIGVPLLAMHSSRELMGAKDQESLTRLIRAYFSL